MQEAKNDGANHELTDVPVSRTCRIQHQRLLLKNSRSGNDTRRGNFSFQSTCKRRFCCCCCCCCCCYCCFVFYFFQVYAPIQELTGSTRGINSSLYCKLAEFRNVTKITSLARKAGSLLKICSKSDFQYVSFLLPHLSMRIVVLRTDKGRDVTMMLLHSF